MLDRVTERRRVAQLARHYRDQEGLSIAEIARRLGRAEATIKAYLYDPTGDKARAVKARYRGVCRGCGAPTAPRNGKGDAYAYCKRCHPGAIAPQWTRNGFAKRCAHGERATALRRRPTTGRAPTHAGAAPSAQTTTSRRMARAVHRHRSVRELGGGRRGRLRRRLSVRASMPLTYERGLALDRVCTGAAKVAATLCHCVRRGRATPRARGRLSAAVRRTEAQIPGRRRSRPRRERDYRNRWGSHREHRAPPDARPVAKELVSSATGRDHGSRHRHQWPTAASLG